MDPLCELLILPDVPTFAAFHFNSLFNEGGKKLRLGKSNPICLSLTTIIHGFLCVKSQNQFKYFIEKLIIIISKTTFYFRRSRFSHFVKLSTALRCSLPSKFLC